MKKVEAKLFFYDYKYFPYEKELAKKEIEVLLNGNILSEIDNGYLVELANINALKNLVYYTKYEIDNIASFTLQSLLESSCTISGEKKKQSTRYSVHGLHEYKGKFNPQIVKGIINSLGISNDAKIYDPFCGSGTTLTECAIADYQGIGTDINPLAVYLTNAKLKAINVQADTIKKYYNKILSYYLAEECKDTTDTNEERNIYLKKWFDPYHYEKIEKLRHAINKKGGNYKDIFFSLVSDLLRDYSLQEPSDLRIRKRKSPLPDRPFEEALEIKINNFINNMKASQTVVGLKNHSCNAYNDDSRNLKIYENTIKNSGLFDAAVTSPPYATALPYIDTQRLSLIWLDLISSSRLHELESTLIGSRDFFLTQKNIINEEFKANSNNLPKNVYDFCFMLKNTLSTTDGFRRQAMPALMYRYFSDMKKMFETVYKLLKPNAPFALVIGHNTTTLGGNKIDINTPALLKDIALDIGWKLDTDMPLETYQRYGLHSKNAVNAETLLIVRK